MARRRRRNPPEQRAVNYLCSILFVVILAGVLVPDIEWVLNIFFVVLCATVVAFGTGLVPAIASWMKLHAELAAYTTPDPLPRAVRTELVNKALERWKEIQAERDREDRARRDFRAAGMVVDGTTVPSALPVGLTKDAERAGDDQ